MITIAKYDIFLSIFILKYKLYTLIKVKIIYVNIKTISLLIFANVVRKIFTTIFFILRRTQEKI